MVPGTFSILNLYRHPILGDMSSNCFRLIETWPSLNEPGDKTCSEQIHSIDDSTVFMAINWQLPLCKPGLVNVVDSGTSGLRKALTFPL